MRLFIEGGGTTRAVSVAIDDPGATISDLCEALDFDPRSTLVVDGVVQLPDARLADVSFVHGAHVVPLDSERPRRSGMGKIWVGVVSGPDAGAVKRIDSLGSVSIGSGHLNDLVINNDTVSREHALVETTRARDEIFVEDLDSRNGTWMGDRPIRKPVTLSSNQAFRVGSSTIAVREVACDDEPLGMSARHRGDSGRALFNRPPRGPSPAESIAIGLPDPLPVRTAPTLAILSLLLPIVVAGAMVMVLGSWRYALFGLLSPLMALGNWLSAKRRAKKDSANDSRSHKRALHAFERQLDAADAQKRDRLAEIAPDLLEVRRRAELPSTRLWERRLKSGDALKLRIGVGRVPFTPVIDGDLHAVAVDVHEALDAHRALDDAEIVVDLTQGPLGLIGVEPKVAAVARALLLQLATHHGPADVQVVVLTSEHRIDDWAWAQWLPHVERQDGGVRILSGTAAMSFADRLVDDLGDRDADPAKPAVLLVADDPELLHRRASGLRKALEHVDKNVFGIVLSPTRDQLPASIATVGTVDAADGLLELAAADDPASLATGVADTVSVEVALDIARSLARFEDPEHSPTEGRLPAEVTAHGLLDVDCDPRSVAHDWRLNRSDRGLRVSIGIAQDGPFSIDLVEDGPHCLVAGTTGSGKSELLRSLVAGLACNYSPDDLVFVLIDYKGGSAFDACADLPHVVGVVTDLDSHLSERALRSLEAELRYREEILRATGAKDIADYHKQSAPEGPLPRLMIVIDEFATLRAELPDFVSALIGVAQRGRSLGVHLVLATQRPSGSVDANIKANTNLRIALRVQDSGDSRDVIDAPDAAMIPRTIPGRAIVRRGDGDRVSIQTAYVSGPPSADGPPVRVSNVRLGEGAPPERVRPAVDKTDETELGALVEACRGAAGSRDTPRRPWTEPLPEQIPGDSDLVDESAPSDEPVILAVGDDPDQQRNIVRGWSPASGHLGVIGVLGSGVSTAIRNAVLAVGAWAAQGRGGRPVWVYAVDHGSGGLEGLDAAKHVSPKVDGADVGRQTRLLEMLVQELDARRDQPERSTDAPLIVVAIDGIASFVEALDLTPGTSLGDDFNRICRDGPAVGLVLLVGAQQASELPRSLRTTVRHTIVLEQRDANAYGDFALRPAQLPRFVPGRALLEMDGMVVQVIDWESVLSADTFDDLDEPPEIEALGTNIASSVLPPARLRPEIDIPLAIGDRTREPMSIRLRAGEHAIVAGPSGSGRTSTLQLAAASLRRADPDLVLVGVAPGDDPHLFDAEVFDAGGSYDDLEHVLAQAETDDRRWVIVVDDADRLELDQGPLFDIARTAPPNVNLIVGLRASTARQAYGHWSRFVRASGVGVLLQPDNGVDGELLSVRLPRHERLPAAPGRGYLVQRGTAAVVQICR